jgi:ABC-type antimicrobial peptide transport system permease subunit
MFKNNLKSALRNIGRYKTHSFINIAGLAVGIACVNFMNLATARSANRAREVGLRKVFGARRGQLIHQFYGECFILMGAALLLALATVSAQLVRAARTNPARTLKYE